MRWLNRPQPSYLYVSSPLLPRDQKEKVFIRDQLPRILPAQHIQHYRVRNQLRIIRVLLHRRRQRRLRLGETAQVQLRNGLADDGQRRRGVGVRGEFLVDVVCGLVLFAAL